MGGFCEILRPRFRMKKHNETAAEIRGLSQFIEGHDEPPENEPPTLNDFTFWQLAEEEKKEREREKK